MKDINWLRVEKARMLLRLPAILAPLALMVACGGDRKLSSENEQLRRDNDALKTQNAELKRDNEVLKTQTTELVGKANSLQASVDSLRQTPAALLEQAILQKQSSHFDEAAQMLEQVMAKAPGTEYAKSAQRELDIVRRAKSDAETSALLNRATEERAQSKFDEAIALFDQVVAAAPSSDAARLAKRELAATRKQQKDAANAAERERRNAFTDVGGGFGVRKVGWRSQMGEFTEIFGELKSISGREYTMLGFTMSLYNEAGDLLGTAPIAVTGGFTNGQIKTFQTLAQVPASHIHHYQVQFDHGL